MSILTKVYRREVISRTSQRDNYPALKWKHVDWQEVSVELNCWVISRDTIPAGETGLKGRWFTYMLVKESWTLGLTEKSPTENDEWCYAAGEWKFYVTKDTENEMKMN